MRNRHAVLFNLRSRGSSPARNRSPGTRIRALLAREEESRGTAWKNGRHFISGRGGERDLASAIISRCKWSGRISSGRLISVAGNARSICRSLSIDRPTPGPAHCHAEWLQLHAISIIMTKSRSCARCSYGARENGEREDDRRFRLRKAASSLPGEATIIDQRSTRVRVAVGTKKSSSKASGSYAFIIGLTLYTLALILTGTIFTHTSSLRLSRHGWKIRRRLAFSTLSRVTRFTGVEAEVDWAAHDPLSRRIGTKQTISFDSLLSPSVLFDTWYDAFFFLINLIRGKRMRGVI